MVVLLDGSRSILSRVGTIMDGTNDEKSPENRVPCRARVLAPRVSATGEQESFRSTAQLLNFGGGCGASKIQRNEGLCM